MNKIIKTVLIVLVVLVVASGLFFAGQFYGSKRSAPVYGYGSRPMMGGRGGWNDDGYRYGPMMGGREPMMGRRGYVPGYTGNVKPLTVDEARQAAQSYLDKLGIAGLETAEAMVFDNNAYVIVKETDTGMGAFELLVDPVSKVAYPEQGPNMMWNLKYGGINHGTMMGGRGMKWMMGGSGQTWNATPANVSSEMPVSEEQASQSAQTYLDKYLPGNTVADHATSFYGYYTFDFEKNGKVVGMLSVNGYNRDVFVHTWHGTFIAESE
jgi:hypothetical protein